MDTLSQEAIKTVKPGPHFDWSDPFLFEDQLSEEERLIQETAQGFAQDRLRPRVIEAYLGAA